MFSLPALGNGSTADSPSPPSSLSESPTSMSGTFFGSDDAFGYHSNPFSPSTSSAFFGNNSSNLFPTMTTTSSKKNTGRNNNKFELDSPSPVGSLSSDLDSLSLGGGASASASPSPPLMNAGAVMDLSRQLRLPIFSRISETLNED